MKSKILAGLTLLITIIPTTAFSQSTSKISHPDTSSCYMQSANGQIINLSSLCGASNNDTSSINPNYKSSSYTRPSYNSSTSGSTRQVINTSTSENQSTDINQVREEIDRKMFGGLNNGYDSSGACVNQASTSNYWSSQCGGSANQQRRNSQY